MSGCGSIALGWLLLTDDGAKYRHQLKRKFSYTGLAYVDVSKLKRSEVLRGIDGESWIYTNRKKTDTLSRIPLLPSALEIMKRYQENPQCQRDDKVGNR